MFLGTSCVQSRKDVTKVTELGNLKHILIILLLKKFSIVTHVPPPPTSHPDPFINPSPASLNDALPSFEPGYPGSDA